MINKTIKEQEKNDLLEKLVDGSISPVEYRKLELAALDDPFLFDALEGYVLNSPIEKSHITDIMAKVNSDITQKQNKTTLSFFNSKRLYTILGSIAATATLFFIVNHFMTNELHDVGTMASELKIPPAHNEPAQNPNQEITTIKKGNDSSIVQNTDNSNKKIFPAPTNTSNQSNTETPFEDNDGTEDLAVLVEEKTNDNNEMAELKANNKHDKSHHNTDDDAPPQPASVNMTSANTTQHEPTFNKTKSRNQIHYSGKITNAQGRPVTNARIITQEKSVFTSSDGSFDLELSAGNHFAVISHQGYSTKGLHISRQEKIEIALKDLSEQYRSIQVYSDANFEKFSDKVRFELLRFLKENKIEIETPINTYFMVDRDGSIADIIVLGAYNFELQDRIKSWIRENKSYIPAFGREEVLEMEIKVE
jgi:hypothetical protein